MVEEDEASGIAAGALELDPNIVESACNVAVALLAIEVVEAVILPVTLSLEVELIYEGIVVKVLVKEVDIVVEELLSVPIVSALVVVLVLKAEEVALADNVVVVVEYRLLAIDALEYELAEEDRLSVKLED